MLRIKLHPYQLILPLYSSPEASSHRDLGDTTGGRLQATKAVPFSYLCDALILGCRSLRSRGCIKKSGQLLTMLWLTKGESDYFLTILGRFRTKEFRDYQQTCWGNISREGIFGWIESWNNNSGTSISDPSGWLSTINHSIMLDQSTFCTWVYVVNSSR